MAKSKADNIGSCVEYRSHLRLDPEPMWVDNSLGHKAYKALGGVFSTRRTKSMLHVDDMSNKSGERAKGGY